jgi:hypothetical protein
VVKIPFAEYDDFADCVRHNKDKRDLKPVYIQAGSFVTLDRDMFNIDWYKTFNAWDVELIIVVDE